MDNLSSCSLIGIGPAHFRSEESEIFRIKTTSKKFLNYPNSFEKTVIVITTDFRNGNLDGKKNSLTVFEHQTQLGTRIQEPHVVCEVQGS